jgi:guanylate kinase
VCNPVRRSSVPTGPGLLFVVSGPSGAGKDTLVDGLRLRHQRLKYSVSATTRAPRPGEREGIEYFFVTREAFEQKLAAGGFIEHRLYNDNLYGTPRSFINEALLDGYDVIMKPEVNGAIAIKERFPEAVLIFIVPDRFSVLQSRLEARRTESNDVIAARLAIAHEELRYVRLFDYLLVNEEARPGVAVGDLEAIVRAERMRIYRYPDTRIKEIEEN